MTAVGRVGIIGGAGWLGTAIAKAVLASGRVASPDLTCSYRRRKPDGGVDCAWTADNQDLVERSDVVILSVRPHDWASVDIDATGKLVISVMAGVTMAEIESRSRSARVASALPNAATTASTRAHVRPTRSPTPATATTSPTPMCNQPHVVKLAGTSSRSRPTR